MSKIIDIKMIEVQRINKQYSELLDKKMKLEEVIANLEMVVCEKSLELIEIKGKIRKIESTVIKEISCESK